MDHSDSLLDEFLAITELQALSDDEDEIQSQLQPNISQIGEDPNFLNEINNLEANNVKTQRAKNKTKINSVNTNGTKNTLHNGDTDSSDDEHNRDYQNSRYSEYGRDLKHLLEDQATTSITNGTIRNRTATWKQRKSGGQLETLPKQKTLNFLKSEKSEIYTDPFFGIRISKPLISSFVLQERMEGRTAVSMAKVKDFIRIENNAQDWVIAGVIVSKSAVKTSQKGSQFLIWTLSDLKGDLKTIAVFLFGAAFKELWKTTVGTVLGILNPSVMNKRDDSKDQAALSIDNSQKVMIFGHSKDYGICKSKKKSGEQCTAFVNTNHSEYCVYHIRQEYQKLAKRSELQSTFAGRGLTALRNKVLGKNEVFYAGKSYMAIPAKKNKKQIQRDTMLLDSLSEMSKSGITTSAGIGPVKNKIAQSLEISRSQRIKDLQLLKKLRGESEVVSEPLKTKELAMKKIDKALNVNKAVLHAEDILRDMEMLENAQKNRIINKDANRLENNIDKTDVMNINNSKNQVNTTEAQPSTSHSQLSQKQKNSSNISKFDKNKLTSKLVEEQNVSVNKHKNEVKENSKALNGSGEKFRLEDYKDLLEKSKMLKSLGTPKLSSANNSKIDLNSPLAKTGAIHMDRAKLQAIQYVRTHGPIKKSEENKKKGVKRFLESSEDNIEEKKPKLADATFTSQRFKQIMALSSKHSNLLEDVDREKEEKYFKKLEIKEKMEEKMMTVFKVDCKAVKCLTCKYTNFSAADKCKEERHVLKVFDAVKRFFKCAKCGNRTVSLEIIPLVSCSNCGCSKWERTTMMKQKTVHIGETLSLRGLEEKYIGTVNTGGNINLLVPDE